MNAYLREVTGQDFTAKDFRTWAGTVLVVTALRELDTADSDARARKNVLRAIEAVAGVLGNTRAVCRKSYIHPAVLDAYMGGSLADRLTARGVRKTVAGLRADEMAVLHLLQGSARRAA